MKPALSPIEESHATFANELVFTVRGLTKIIRMGEVEVYA